ncbi:MAG: nitrate reductase molybdenum cofactor assembly chaperone, partial [Candidatus Dormibacteraceae bacterium]
DYPERSIARSVEDCIAELAGTVPEAYALLIKFQSAMAEIDAGQLQELYTNAFDLRPDCTPNLGYHMFGDDARRGVFLVELKQRMEAIGIPLGTELADHLSLILRYLDGAGEDRAPVVEECLLPSVSRMAEVLAHSGNPYEYALGALLALLRHQHDPFVISAGAAGA